MTNRKMILVLVGPSGSGKTTVGNELSKYGIPKLITTTTREPRRGERNGVDYYFCPREEMSEKSFVEQTTYNNNIYGLTIKEVEKSLESSDIVHVSLDQHGVKTMKEAYPKETCIIFFDVPEEEMRARMEKRGDNQEKIDERLAFGRKTGEYIPPQGTDLIVENEKVEQSVQYILKSFNIEM